MSKAIAGSLEAFGKARDAMAESLFLTTYGSPLLQAMVGLGPSRPHESARAARDLARETAVHRLKGELERNMEHGGPLEAGVRGLFYVLRADGRVDERAATMLETLRSAQSGKEHVTRERFREVLCAQALTLRLDEERAVAAIPKLLPPDAEVRHLLMGIIRRVVEAQGGLSEEAKRRLAHLETLFDTPAPAPRPARKRPAPSD